MILYHFTTRAHMPAILADGFLRTTESNVSGRREHAGPDVVWLTTDPNATGGHGLDVGINAVANLDGARKTDVRFTVDVDKRSVHKWREWTARQGMSRDWVANLASVGDSGTWRVVERPLPAAQWKEVRDMETGVDYLDDAARHSAGSVSHDG